tara:strand:- start:36142 stop:38625 length:2484 start_codon:yes stop_codon:yes gene_type:complete
LIHKFEQLLTQSLDPALEEEQRRTELEGVNEGVAKYRKMLLEGNIADTGAGRQIFKEVMGLVIPAIRKAQEEAVEGIANSGPGVRPVWWWYISFVSPEKLAYIALRSVLGVRMVKAGYGRPARSVCLTIGLAVKQQVEFEKWLRDSKDEAKNTGGPDLAARLVRTAKNFNQRQWGNWSRRIKSIETLDWRRDVRMHIGAKILDLIIENGGGFFEMKYVQVRNKTERQVFLSDACRAMMDDINSQIELSAPTLKPMIVEPRPWSWDEINKRYDGGYFMVDVDFIRGGLHKHTASLDNPFSRTTLRAANYLGWVAWRVDEEALELAKETFLQNTQAIACIPSPDPEPLPPRKTDIEWDGMSKAERAAWKYDLNCIHDRNASEVSKRESVIRKFNLTDQVKGRDVYNVIKCDSRSRFYYVTPDWNPQGDSLARGTMRFADGQPLGKDGLYWLAVRLCNTYGEDKISFDEMQEWAKDNHDLIVQSATDPFGSGERLWTHADSELEFWQTCVDWSQATGMDNPEKFVCTLPVHQDGSNNGLQLLSLLGRDPVGAKLTNCSSSPERFDIYSETAEVVKRLVADDVANGRHLEQAHRWIGNIDRAVCKRACMTTSYGVTPRGIQDQLIKDGFVDKLDGSRLENAGYMRDKLMVALDQTIVASRPIMEYFQKCAVAMAEFDLPLRWVTPVGSTIQQSYWNVAKSDVKTVMGSYFMWDENPDGGLSVRKQMLSSSPNIIHSIDAALMQKVIVELREEHHVYSIAAIHDSFAVLPCNVGLMRDVIRQTAYDMFKGNWIEDSFHPYLKEYAPNVDLPEPPAQGDFNIKEVLDAEYFFA